MKKLLSIALSVLLLVSCMSVGLTMLSGSADGGASLTVACAVEPQNGLQGGVIAGNATQNVVSGQEVTVSAQPYYGNGFLGWYDGTECVSTDVNYTFTASKSVELKAKFDIRNQIENGNYEVASANEATAALYNSYTNYSPTYRGTAAISAVDATLASQYGSYALSLTSAQNGNAAMRKSLLSFPVTVEKNKDYIWRYSYRTPATGSTYALHLSVSVGAIEWSPTLPIKWTAHSETAVTNVDATDKWTWKSGATFTGTSQEFNRSRTEGQWEDVFMLMNFGEDASIFGEGNTATVYLNFGCRDTNTNTVYLVDNISFSEAVANDRTTIADAKGVTVKNNTDRYDDTNYWYTSVNTSYTDTDQTKTYYPAMYESYTATHSSGAEFLGWYNKADKCVSKETTAQLLTTGEKYTPKFDNSAVAQGGGYIKDNGDDTVTAVPYYGNIFLGWSEDGTEIVSTATTISVSDSEGKLALFSTDNLVFDGDFESGNPATETYYNSLENYSTKLFPSYEVADTCVPDSGAEFGEKCLLMTPHAEYHNDKMKGLISIPVNVTAGKTYIAKYAIAYPNVGYDKALHYLYFSIDKPTDSDKIVWNPKFLFSWHQNFASTVGLDTDNKAWGTNNNGAGAYVRNYQQSTGNEWMYEYFIFTPDTTDTYYITIGTPQDVKTPIAIDNISCSEVVQITSEVTDAPTVVTAGEYGTVASYQTDVPAYRSAANFASNTAFTSKEADPYYGKMYNSYYAVPERGYMLEGWYDTEGEKVSTDEVFVTYSLNGNYTAKFVADPNKYRVDTVVKAQDGVLGGYIIDNITQEEYFNGEDVNLTAIPYEGNKFVGWFDENGEPVSSNADYVHTIKKNITLEARFECNNLFADSGYENTKSGTPVWGTDKDWYSDDAAAADMSASVISVSAADGSQSLNFGNAANKNLVHKAIAVDADSTYHLAFNWRATKEYSDGNTGLASVKILNAADNSVIAENNTLVEAIGQSGWQKFHMNFATGTATSVKVVIKFTSDTATFFVDQLALFNTADTNFVINSSLEMVDGYYPGVLSSAPVQSAANGTEVTVSVSTYERNVFLGWYESNKLISDQETYKFNADANYNLVAKFEICNQYPDSGFENTALGDATSGNDALWTKGPSWAAIVITDAAARSGSRSVKITNRNNKFYTKIAGLEESTDYAFTFWWKPDAAIADPTTLTFDVVNVTGVQTEKVLGSGFGTTGSSEWQKFVVAFNSGTNTEATVDFTYTHTSGSVLIDDIAVYKSNNLRVIAGQGGDAVSTHTGPVDAGTEVTVTATPDGTNTFLGWYDYYNIAAGAKSTDLTYTFPVTESVTLYAIFEGENVDPINYYPDGNFENGLSHDVQFSHPWNSSAWCNYSIVSGTNTIQPVSGNSMMKLTCAGQFANWFATNLKPQTDYTVSFWYTTENDANYLGNFTIWRHRAEHSMDFVDGSSTEHVKNNDVDARSTCFIDPDVLNYYADRGAGVGGNWQYIELPINTGNRDTIMLHISTSKSSGSNQGLYIDDFRITEGNSYTDTIVNGDFEDAAAVNGWEGAYTTATAADNTYGVTSGEIYNKINLETTEAYTINFKAKSDANAVIGAGLALSGADSITSAIGDNATTNTSYKEITLTNEWKEYSVEVFTKTYLNYKAMFKSLNGAEFMIDDVVIAKTDGRSDVEEFNFEADENLSIIDTYNGHSAQNNLNKKYFSITNEENHTDGGSSSLMMRANDGSFESHSLAQKWNKLSLQRGTVYNISFWAKAAAPDTEFRFFTFETGTDWELIYSVDETITLDSTDWTYFEFEASTQHTTNYWNMFEFMVDATEGTDADIYFDDFKITESNKMVTDTAPTKLYTQDTSQNYFPNYSFEKDGDEFQPYVVSGDAFFGNRYITLNKGDKIVVPVTTRPDYNGGLWGLNYTLAASIRGNSASDGYVGLSLDSAGTDLMCDSDGNVITLASNTDGAWKRSGFTFYTYKISTVYLVIECYEGSFDVDYISMSNINRTYAENQHDFSVQEFSGVYDDMSLLDKGNYINGEILGLPQDSYVILKGAKSYKSAIDSTTGYYEFARLAEGVYDMYIAAGGTEMLTLWGSISLKNGEATGLACERLSGNAILVSGEGVRNGIVKIIDTSDDDNQWAYLSATDKDGKFSAYILDSKWMIAGTNNDPATLNKYGVKLADFGASAAIENSVASTKVYNTVATAAANDTITTVTSLESNTANSLMPVVVIVATLLLVFAALVVYKKKGVNV